MKRKLVIALAILVAVWIGYRAYRISTTRSHSPADSINYSYQDLDINVTYSRPYKKGRLIFGHAKDRAWLPDGQFWTVAFRALTGLPRTSGALVPYGEYWRLGANDATEISFSKNIHFAGEPVNAGSYRMYAVPGEKTWEVTLNSETGKFGYLPPSDSLDVLTVVVPVEISPTEVEQFTIGFDGDSTGVKMNFVWDRTLVKVPIEVE